MISLIHRFRITIGVAAFALILSPAFAANPMLDGPVEPDKQKQDLSNLGIEDLMKIQVTTASKSAQSLSSVPAAVFVITQEDIRRAGARSIPEALRLAPGVQVARVDGSKWAISIRGFNTLFANKLLVLIDGRSVYTPLFSGVYWDAQDTLIEDVERIEVVRGPGGSLWGVNAVNGVINIITKNSKDTVGQLATAEAGDALRGEFAYRYGGKSGTNSNYRVYGKYFSQRDSLYTDGTRGKDGWDSLRAGFRVDSTPSANETSMLTGEIYSNMEGQRSVFPSFAPPFATLSSDKIPASGWHLLGRVDKKHAGNQETSFQAYYDRTQRNSVEVAQSLDVFDLDIQHRFPLGSKTMMNIGGGFRRLELNTSAGPFTSILPSISTDQIFSTFVQGETALSKYLHLTLGTRFELTEDFKFEIQPNIRLAWTPDPRRTLWASASRAVRTPSDVEDGSASTVSVQPGPGGLPLQVTINGSDSFAAEEVIAYELGYRVEPTKRLSIDIAAFCNQYDSLRSFEAGATGMVMTPVPHLVMPLTFSNNMYGKTHGVELSARWQASNKWDLALGYTYFKDVLHLNAASNDPFGPNAGGANSAPRHQVSLRSHLSLPRHFELDTFAQYVDSLSSQSVSQYLRVDARLGWSPSKSLELSAGVNNLFGAPHQEFGSALYEQPALMERSVYGKATWRF